MLKSTIKRGNVLSWRIAAIAVALLMLAACTTASYHQSQTSLQTAEQAITNARQVGVADYAPLLLSDARKELADARIAFQRGNTTEAQRLAELSFAGTTLAVAKTELIKAQAVNDEMQKNIDTLKQKTQHKTELKKREIQ